ncbi:winged helix-turn-helix transcriptional regulator [Candidatus Bathyarchaeota archaeon]|nr:winged helix-turn-helix transcriptional regulator [Candidatus Bathyarchaeota archaeon]
MNKIELRLLCELMKNSRRSDRELAKALGVSQPTVSRTLKRLETKGYVKEYTILPDFAEIGFEIMAITFAKLREHLTREELEKARNDVREMINRESSSIILGMSGMGCEADRVIISLHEDYPMYSSFMRFLKNQTFVKAGEVQSFVIDLTDKDHFLPLSFSSLARYILRSERITEKQACKKEIE